jgi:hypothetical protein
LIEQLTDSPLTALNAAAVVASIGVIVLGMEDIRTARDFRTPGLMSWEISRLGTPWANRGRVGAGLDAFLRFERFRTLMVVRVAAAVVVAVGAAAGVLIPAAILVVVCCLLALSLRSPYGLDGGHQMYVVVFAALFLGSLETADTSVATVAAVFIGSQALLAYLVSGVAKAASERWRSGDAMQGVMATTIYGHARLHALLQGRARLAWLACWSVIALECAFPVAAAVGAPYLHVLLAGGLFFHALTAFVMGLNGFFFAFVATYPCIVYLSAQGPA